jgi:small-conductance mechanosensitive channel
MINWSQTFKTLMSTETVPGVLFMGVLFTFAAWLGGRAVRLAVHRLLDRSQEDGADPTGIRFLGQLSRLMVYIFAAVCYARGIPALEKFGEVFLTSVGVVSIVVGLAAQSTLGNLISGISLVLYRPFKIGDRLKVSVPTGTETGVVESIDLGYTVLRTMDNRRIIIPNNSMASQPCINLSLLPPRSSCDVSVYLASGADLEQGSGILLELAKAHKKLAQIDGCRITRVTAKGTILTLAVSCENPDDAPAIKSDLLRGATARFDTVGIKLV